MPYRTRLLLPPQLILMLLYGAGPSLAEEPYVGEGQLKTFLLNPDGSKTFQRSFRIVVARDRNGSRYRSQERPEGDLLNLWIHESPSAFSKYTIDLATRKAYLRERSSTLPAMQNMPSADQAKLGAAASSFASIPCVKWPINSMESGKRIQAGELCLSQELGLELYSYSEYSIEGKRYRRESEILNLQRGVDPDPSWFKIPPDVVVVEPQNDRPRK